MLKNSKKLRFLFTLLKSHKINWFFGTLLQLLLFWFYLMTVFTLSWATTTDLGYSKRDFYWCSCLLYSFLPFVFRFLRLQTKMGQNVDLCYYCNRFFGFSFSYFLNSAVTVWLLSFMHWYGWITYGPLGTFLSELFPTTVRYSGASLTFNLAGILGAALLWLQFGCKYLWFEYVGFYLTVAACISLFAQWVIISKERIRFKTVLSH
jgi:hypothetical protein